MLHPVIGRCPVCGDELSVTRLHARPATPRSRAAFSWGAFSAFPPINSPSSKSSSRTAESSRTSRPSWGSPYPTVRARLDDALRAMGFPAGGEDDPRISPREARSQAREERRRILEDLKAQRISADEAARQLAG